MSSILLRITICTVALWLLAPGRVDATYSALGDYPMGGTYAGMLPCSDCGGIWVEVTLSDMGPDLGDGKGTFVMTQRFTGGVHGGTIVTTHGSWFGTFTDPRYTGNIALIYTTPEGTQAPALYFYCDHGRYLRLLPERSPDFGFAVQRGGFSMLQRVLPRPRFGPLTEQDSRGTIFARVGDEFTIVLPAASSDATLTEWTVNQPAQGVVVEGVYGSGNGTTFSSNFSLRAAKPGRVQLVFRSADHPGRTVTFSFDVSS